MADQQASAREPHDPAEELLPWYATGQLDDADREKVEQHLLSCAACCERLAAERLLVQEFRALAPDVQSGWVRMRARLARPEPQHGAAARVNSLTEAARRLWSTVTRPAVIAVATAELAAVACASALVIWLSQPVYHTLGSRPVAASANIIVLFRPQARVEDVQNALRGAGATVVGGPTPAGAYLLKVEPSRRTEALVSLHANREIETAEPIGGGGQ